MTIHKNTIRYKLYKSFAIVLSMVVLLFVFNYVAVRREQSAKGEYKQASPELITETRVQRRVRLDRLKRTNLY